ncbi:hypothetical protein [Shinella sumterensis]|uniref:hypothetical protein n=1 Tax=Shinella sumterensis TaxID=1967501 RepID=UPI001E2AD1D7|nr:hypothetical protein [Shinella sumterensis]
MDLKPISKSGQTAFGGGIPELAKVQSGQRQQPSVEEFLAEIEPIEWPALAA